ncbi:MAG TPA: UDP-N-acetylmuramoyl-L-alanine--D-glutamate ligase [Verrucomicrobiae bacterium]|jgi:UDP-N-acetylmuramoylalanine--D-glutamate ligase|nr:UDP-N-acetylmuramoyl-L-alanine--D-glutamate ligase [Verrucomicrobiae bacterium]
MHELQDKHVLVVGLGQRGRAACGLLRKNGAKVTAMDLADTAELRTEAGKLRQLGVEVKLGVAKMPKGEFSLAITSPAVDGAAPILRELGKRQVPVIGEFELGYQHARCLNIAIAGTNGKGTTSEMLEQILLHSQRKTVVCGHGARPVCSTVLEAGDVDFLIFQLNAFQLETTQFFRPAVAVLLNITPDHLDRYPNHSAYVRATAKLFENQQAFDWAIVQSETLAELRALNIEIPAKVITFSANNRRADIFLDRGLLISRLPDWSGPLLDMSQCRLQGSHNAENMMAALAAGHVLRLPLDGMVEVLKQHAPAAHRFEKIAEINGVTYINDSKATNVDALHKALLSVSPAPGGDPNIWLIAGGKDKRQEFHYVGPLISQRVKGAFVIGEASGKIRAAWSLFTPCAATDSLLEAVILAAKNAVAGDVILLSPACPSFDQFRNYQHRGDVFREAVNQLPGVRGVEKSEAISPDETAGKN